MKILYLDCAMGAAGDMLMAALLELLPDAAAFLQQMNGLDLPQVEVFAKPCIKRGIAGTQIRVTIDGKEEPVDLPHDAVTDEVYHHHSHSTLASVSAQIAALPLSDKVKQTVQNVYNLLAEAEAAAHGCPVEQIHFHEVGTLDAIADITGVCLAMDLLAVDKVVVSPVCVGFGEVRCAHGVLSVPAPATAHLLQGIPCYAGNVKSELCTPTGAALLKYFGDEFSTLPLLTVEKIGYGMGHKEFVRANCVRAILGTASAEAATADAAQPNEKIVELSCNLDDMTGEDLSYAIGQLFAAGALDVFTLPIQMKKQRPAQMLVCLATAEQADQLAAVMLRETTTFGVRRYDCSRYSLARSISTQETAFGPVRIKHGHGYGIEKSKPEHDDILRAAAEHQLSPQQIRSALKE